MMPAPRIGYVLKRYPRFSETFVVNEILAHEEAGQEIEIFALRPVAETHFQEAIARVRAPVTRIPDKTRSPAILWSLLAEAVAALPGAAARALASGGTADDVCEVSSARLYDIGRGASGISTRISARWRRRSRASPRPSAGSATASPRTPRTYTTTTGRRPGSTRRCATQTRS